MAAGEERCGKLASAQDADLVEHRSQVFLDGAGEDVQLADDLAGWCPCTTSVATRTCAGVRP